MATFKVDSREYQITLDAPTIRTVRTECHVDLADADGKAFDKLADDPCLLVDVLWVLCRKQAQTAGITDEQFGASLVGDAIERATEGLLAAIMDFFPKRRRELLAAMANKNAKIREQGTERAMAKINDPELEKKVLDALETRMDAIVQEQLEKIAKIHASAAINTPASSEYPPTAEPSAN